MARAGAGSRGNPRQAHPRRGRQPRDRGRALNVLGFDTSTAASSACVLADGRVHELTPAIEALGAPPAHARDLLPAIHEVMDRAGLAFPDLDAVAVGTGPGGFTGLRIGLATAHGLAIAHDLPLRPVSSLAALSEGIGGTTRLALVDARRGELFAQLDDGAETVLSPFCAAPDTVIERVAATGLAARAAGDGALRFEAALEAAGVEVAPAGSTEHVVRALHICRLGERVDAVAAAGVLPDYLRSPDAKPQP